MKPKMILPLIFLFPFVTTSYSQTNQGAPDTVRIGSNVWMTKNFDVDHFANGDFIPEVKTPEEWRTFADKQLPAWCYYNNDPSNGKKWGKLYNWYALHDSRSLPPKGWHIPSNEEWDSLISYLGGVSSAGGTMKNTSSWKGNGNGNNKSGFSALPGGVCDEKGSFYGKGKYGHWWSSSGHVVSLRSSSKFVAPSYEVDLPPPAGGSGFSVRCIKD